MRFIRGDGLVTELNDVCVLLSEGHPLGIEVGMGVDERGPYVRVSQQLAYDHDVRAVLQQVGRERVPRRLI